MLHAHSHKHLGERMSLFSQQSHFLCAIFVLSPLTISFHSSSREGPGKFFVRCLLSLAAEALHAQRSRPHTRHTAREKDFRKGIFVALNRNGTELLIATSSCL